MQHFPKVLDYLDEFEVPWLLCRDVPDGWPLWNGAFMLIARGSRYGNREMTADLILHELAHWQLEADHRHLPNYGLGPDPLDGGPRQEWRRGSDRREDLASALTVCHARACGHHWRQVAYDFGCLHSESDARYWSTFMYTRRREFRKLRRFDLVDERGSVCRS